MFIVVDCPFPSAQLLNTDRKLSQTGLLLGLSHLIPLNIGNVNRAQAMIKNTSFHKHLGLIFSNTGSWDEYIKTILEKSC